MRVCVCVWARTRKARYVYWPRAHYLTLRDYYYYYHPNAIGTATTVPAIFFFAPLCSRRLTTSNPFSPSAHVNFETCFT